MPRPDTSPDEGHCDGLSDSLSDSLSSGPNTGHRADLDLGSDRWEAVRRLTRSCHHRMGRPLAEVELEDAIQTVCLAALQDVHRMRRQQGFDTWVYGVARLTILKVMRDQSRRTQMLSGMEDAEHVAIDSRTGRLGQGTRREIRERVQTLGTTLCGIVVGRFEHGLSFEALARGLGLSCAAVRSRYYRLVPRLGVLLGPIRDRLGGTDRP